MPPDFMPPTQYIFADFLAGAREEILYKAGEPLKFQIRTFQVLRLLLENAGSVVRKEDCFEKVWQGAFVEDNNLTVAVAQIRKVLGETSGSKFIETVPKKGCRFVAEVEKIFNEKPEQKLESSPAPETVVSENPIARPSEKSNDKNSDSRVPKKFLIAVGLILLILSAGAFWRYARHESVTTNDPEAREFYLQGKKFLAKTGSKDFEKAIETFTAAVVKDASFVEARSALATAHVKHGLALYSARGLSASRRSFPLAKESALETLKIKPDSDEALAALAFVNSHYEYDWQTAEANFRRTLEINPKNILAHRWFGEFLHQTGRFDESFDEQQKALALAPDSAQILGEIAWGNYLARRFDEAETYSKKPLKADNTHAATLYNLSEINEQKGNLKEAVELWKKAMMNEAAARRWIANVEQKFQTNGRAGFVRAKAEWLEDLIGKDYIYPTDLAKCYAVLGDGEKAVGWLEKGIEAKVPDLLSVKQAPAFDALKNDERYQRILEKMNFPK